MTKRILVYYDQCMKYLLLEIMIYTETCSYCIKHLETYG